MEPSGSKSSVWPITKGKLSTANAISPNSKCINLQENNKIILLEETLKLSLYFHFKGNKRTDEMLFKGQSRLGQNLSEQFD